MKKVLAIMCLSLLPLIASADGNAAAPPAAAAPAAAISSAATGSADSGSMWRTVVTGVGLVGGVIVADLLVGGTLTASLFGWGTAATAAPVVYSPEILGARAAGAVLGEMIAPATHARDVIARRDMFYTFVLGVGAVAGATAAYWWAGGTADAGGAAAPVSGK